jgi:hypothetical protein
MDRLKHIIRNVKSVNNHVHGNEFYFTQKIKHVLPTTNFELIGEEFFIRNQKNVWRCDLWLANIPNNFLLSLELKVGRHCDNQKQLYLKTQVLRYTDLMRFYYPDDQVYGMGAYKCITKQTNKHKPCVKFVDYIIPVNDNHIEEMNTLKLKIQTECLD